MIEKNKQALQMMIQINDKLNDLKIVDNFLIWGEEKVDISNFDFTLLLNEGMPLMDSLDSLTAEDVYKIINIHALTINSQINLENKQGQKTKNEVELEALKEKNSLLKDITISYKKNEDGFNEEYINIVDSEGNDHLLHNYYRLDLIELYIDLVKQHGESNNITPEQMYSYFKNRCKEVNLENNRDMMKKSDVSEDFAEKVNNFEHDHQDNSHYSFGNEEHDIIVSNDHTVSVYDKDDKGNSIQHSFSSQEKEDEENNKTPTTEEDDEKVVKKEEIVEKIDLISEEEFYNLINSYKSLTESESRQVGLFNAYLGDLIIYEDYLLPELKAILNRFKITIENLELQDSNTLNENQFNEIEKYHEMYEKKENVILNSNNRNLENEVKKLVLQKPKEIDTQQKSGDEEEEQNSGNVNPISIILVMLAMVAIMGLVAMLIVNKK